MRTPIDRLLMPLFAEDGAGGGAGEGGGSGDTAQPDAVKLAADLAATRAELEAAKASAATALADAAKLKAAADAAALKQREADGDLLGLYEETKGKLTAQEQALAAATAKLTAHEAREQARVDALTADNTERLGKLPEPMRALVPAGLDAEATAAQLARVEAIADKATEQPAGGRGGPRAPREPSTEKIPEACLAEAARHDVDPTHWFERVWKPRAARQNKPATA